MAKTIEFDGKLYVRVEKRPAKMTATGDIVVISVDEIKSTISKLNKRISGGDMYAEKAAFYKSKLDAYNELLKG